MACDTLGSFSAFLAAMAIFQQSLLSKATMFGLTAEDQLEVVCNLRLLQLAGSMYLALLCKRKLLPIALESGVL
jgi:hypothetical protein